MVLKTVERSLHNYGAKNSGVPLISKTVSPLLWLLFLFSASALVYYLKERPEWNWAVGIHISAFTLLLWCIVTLFGAIVSSFAQNYLKGFKNQGGFSAMSLGFVFSVLFFVASDHFLLLLLSWLCMGIFMAGLIGSDSTWREAQQAGHYALRFFMLGTALLGLGLLIIYLNTLEATISGAMGRVMAIPKYALWLSGLLIFAAAGIQSAVYPFHRWLLSAMTAPTPASALMHAGFVNGTGILLALLAPLFLAADMLSLLFILGGITAVTAQFAKLIQVNIKQKLACSTIAQMGFMIMQCGLGFFNAAVAHLILHGFYKAYLFLSSGEEIERGIPKKQLSARISPLQGCYIILTGVAGALLFGLLTHKTALADSSIFLTMIVAITVSQASYNIVKEASLSRWLQFTLPLLLLVSGISLYALVYNGVTAVMSEMAMAAVPQPLGAAHMVFGLLFIAGYFAMKLELYRKVPWLYIQLLNATQPYKKTIVINKKS
ncbi:proton-conducting transporter membrane subunit [Flavobacterium beibuense]|uniref:pH adaptation potassium efflux system protein A n=1 Tax=Flavobacterium beibuense TaxID=657326 RepID=A0A444WAC1_9FLAO|nr:proton-conducting transporter membrane subunit [Flavobacterium beibuense]RYJ42841.1 pH adaptation potassium efflux system protein A [Flavobacterium beibuense]